MPPLQFTDHGLWEDAPPGLHHPQELTLHLPVIQGLEGPGEGRYQLASKKANIGFANIF